MIAAIGWTATAVVVASYFFKGERTLRFVQMLGAALWMAYGIAINSAPVVAANILVVAAAAWTATRQRASGGGIVDGYSGAGPGLRATRHRDQTSNT